MESPNPDIINSSSETQKWCGHEHLHKFDGFWFTQTYLQTTQTVLQNFKPSPNQIILASFPKTGTTWLKALLHSITHRSSPDHKIITNPLLSDHPQELVPSLETNLYVQQTDSTDHRKNNKILSTHIPYQIIGDVLNSSDCKIVYITRNPKDALVSLWHFLQKSRSVEDDPWDLATAVDQFCQGIVPFGPYYEHVLAYREESVTRPEKVMLITFEELKEDPKKRVLEIGEFLGCPFEGEEAADEIVNNCSFENLSNLEVNKSTELPPSGFPLPYNSFFRKGEVGDHGNYLDEEMIRKIDAVTVDKFHAAGFMYGI